jgi:iron(II)-dependent oxidoreductase
MPDTITIRRAMEEARAYTLHLLTTLNDADFSRQVHPDFSPIGWHLGHIGVTEAFWILQQCKGEPSLSTFYDHFFTPTDNPKPNRVHLPAREEILAYLDTVRSRVLAFLAHLDSSTEHPLLHRAKIFNMLLQHEEQHNETMLLILQLLAAEQDLPFSPSPLRRGEPVSLLSKEMVFIPGGAFLMGSNDDTTTLDNERPQHAVEIAPFLIDRSPVTNDEFLQFILAGGYDNPACWAPDGWQWRKQHGIEHPLYWRKRAGGWTEVGLTHSRPLAPEHPVMCVSWYEADAYARFVGKRLPTEAEWEKAASWDAQRHKKFLYPWGAEQPEARRCNFGDMNRGTTAVGRYAEDCSPYGCFDMLGNVWEWTSTWFHPYPGFIAYPYEGYSVPYFDQQHRVLKGGSWATRRHVLRPTFRNWYQPWVREIFAGFRCAKDA